MSDFVARIRAELDAKSLQSLEKTQLTFNNVGISNAKFTDAAIKNLQAQLSNLQLNINVGKGNFDAAGVAIGKKIATGVEAQIAKVDTTSLKNLSDRLSGKGIKADAISKIISQVNADAESLNIQVTKISESFKESANAANGLKQFKISGVDEFGNLVNITETWNKDLTKIVSTTTNVTHSFENQNKAVSATNESAKRATESYTKLKAIQSDLILAKKRFNTADPDENGAQYRLLAKQIQELETSYNDLYSTASKDLSTTQIESLDRGFEKLNRDLQLSNAKMADTSALKVKNQAVAEHQAQVDKVIAKYQELGRLEVKRVGLDTSKDVQAIKALDAEIEEVKADATAMYREIMGSLSSSDRDKIYSVIGGATSNGYTIGSNAKALQKATASAMDRQNAAEAKATAAAEKQAIDERKAKYNELIKTLQEVGKVQAKIFQAKQSGNIQETKQYENELDKLLQKYAELNNYLSRNGGLSGAEKTGIAQASDVSIQKLKELMATAEDAKRKLVDALNSDANQSKMAADISNIDSKFEKLDYTSEQFKSHLAELKASFDAVTSDTSSDEAKIAAYNRYKELLPTVRNELTQLVNAQKAAEQESKAEAEAAKQLAEAERQAEIAKQTLTKSSTLSNDIKAWLADNTKAADKFGNELNELRLQLNGNDDPKFLQNAALRFREIKSEAQASGMTIKDFTVSVRNMALQFAGLGSAIMVFQKAVQTIRQMYDEVLRVDTALTELYRVTDLTSEQYSALYHKMSDSAKEYGQTLDTIINSTASWVRLGFDPNTATELAEITSMYQHVTDLDETTAVNNLVTAYKGFQDSLDATFNGDKSAAILRIADIYDKLGNEFAEGAADVGAGLARSASVLQQGGASLEEAAGMLTGIQEVLQDSSVAGSTLKILTLRIRGMKGDLEELGEDVDQDIDSISKMQTQILNLTHGKVNIFDDDGNFRNIYDIMHDISEIYYDLSDPDRAALLETIAGKNRAVGVQALIQNWEQVEHATNAAYDAAGTATDEQAVYMESLQGRVDSLTASWQTFANDFLSSDFVKGLVDSGATLIDTFDTIINVLPGGSASLVGMGLASIVVAKNFKELSTITMTFFGNLADDMGLISAFGGSFGIAAQSGQGLVGVLGSMLSAATPLVPVIATAAAGIAALAAVSYFSPVKQFERLTDTANEARSQIKGTNTEIDTINKSLEQIEREISAINAQGELTLTDDAQIKKLNQQKEVLESQLTIQENLQKMYRENAAATSNNVLTAKDFDLESGTNMMDGVEVAAYKSVDIIEYTKTKYDELQQVQKQYAALLREQAQIDQTSKQFKDNQKQIDAYSKRIANLGKIVTDNTDTITTNYQSLFDVNGEIPAAYEQSANAAKEFFDYVNDASSNGFGSGSKELAQSQYIKNASLIDTLRKKIIDKNFAENETAETIENSINALVRENQAIKDTISQYDLMNDTMNSASEAYETWTQAQQEAQSGTIFDSALGMLQKVRDTLSNKESSDYGRIGNSDYQAAVKFLVPETVDETNKKAVSKYLKNLSDIIKTDENGNYTGLNTDNFLKKAVDNGLMAQNEDGDFELAGQTSMEEFAKGMNMSLPLVQAVFGELKEFGITYDWTTTATQTFGDVAVAAADSVANIRQLSEFSNLDMTIDVSDIQNTDDAIAALDATIKNMVSVKSSVNVDASTVQDANNVIAYCLLQKQMLSEPAIMSVDTSLVSGKIGDAITLLQQFQSAQNNLDMQKSLGLDTKQAQSDLDSIAAKIQGIDPKIATELSVDTSSIDSIQSSLNGITPEMMVHAGVDAGAIIGYQPDDKTATTTYDVDSSKVEQYKKQDDNKNAKVIFKPYHTAVDLYNPSNLTRTVTYRIQTSGGLPFANGTAHFAGTAYGYGSSDWGIKKNEKGALVNELGQEGLVRDGHFMVIPGGAQFVNLKRGDIIFNHKQTAQLLKNGYVTSNGGHGKAYAFGNAYASGTKKKSGSGTTKAKSSFDKIVEKYQSAQQPLNATASKYAEMISYRDSMGYSRTSTDEKKVYSAAISSNNSLLKSQQKQLKELNGAYKKTSKKMSTKERNEAKATIEDLKKSILQTKATIADYQSDLENMVATRLSNINDRREGKEQKLQDVVSNKQSRGVAVSTKDYQNLIDNSKAKVDNLKALNVELKRQRDKYSTDSQKYQDLQKQIESNTNAIATATKDQIEWNNAIAALPYEKLEKALDLLDSISGYDESVAKLKTALGEDLLESDYTKQMEDNSKKIADYEAERKQAFKDYQKALASSDGAYGGKTADEWLAEYNDFGKAINDLKVANEDLKDSMRDDVYWRTFEKAHDAASKLQSVVSGIADLISDDMIFDVNGELTDFGVTRLATLVKQYETARQEVANYSNDLENLEKLYRDGFYTQDEYNDKLSELQGNMLDSAKSMKSFTDEIVSMYKSIDQNELNAVFDLIDARNEALSAKKDYYDYDKTIKAKTKDIQSLTAQIAALDGVETSAAKAKRAQLQAQLSEANDALEDTLNSHAMELSQESLADLKESLQDAFDDRWESVHYDLSEIAHLMQTANNLTASSVGSINANLTELLSFYGVNPVATKLTGVTGYATGTRSSSRGLHWLDELGKEAVMTPYGRLQYLNEGSHVFTAGQTDNLWAWSKITPNINGAGTTTLRSGGSVSAPSITTHYDSLLTVNGNVDKDTLPDLQTLLRKSYQYTQKQMTEDMRRAGYKRKY